ncbi:hypothetical protein ACI2TA_08205 [Ralstonia nicotianae]
MDEIAKIQPALALVISAFALIIALRNYRRKAGVLVRGYFTTGSSIFSNDRYITKIGLENLKDRSITIYAIYIKFGHNYYLELEEFDQPITLKPFETYHKEFGDIEFYSINLHQISLDDLFTDTKIKKRIVLSTSDGRYTVPPSKRIWNPVSDFFHNYATAIIRPNRGTYKGRDLGANVVYVIEVKSSNGEEAIFPIHSLDYEHQRFIPFKITKESLESKEALEALLKAAVDNGSLICEKFKVHDITAWRSARDKIPEKKKIIPRPYNAFSYYVLGRIGTLISNRKMHQENKRLQREFESRTLAATADPAGPTANEE